MGWFGLFKKAAPPEPRIFAAGLPVTCHRGHEMYRLVRDVRAGEPVRAADVVRINVSLPDPKGGDVVPQCWCGHDVDFNFMRDRWLSA